VLHARLGREWYVKQYASLQAALAYGDRCWSKVLMNWRQWREDGLTQHENWWPALYAEWCRVHGPPPAPAALAFHETYETARADLQQISASG
jgi:hypothetical protein